MKRWKNTKKTPFRTIKNSDIKNATVENFLNDIAREKPIRFTRQQLAGFTCNYTTRLGSGRFGVVYKGEFPNGIAVAVKVLNGGLDYKSVEEQFMAEMGTIGRIFHANLVRIYGFCFDPIVRALVYEYMDNGSLDAYYKTRAIPWEKLHEIAIGTARGLTYLHEECEQRIIHYDIKPANILLDHYFSPKVADFGLGKPFNMEDTHLTSEYMAPEIWMGLQVTCKCDVFSFGMLLLKLVGRRMNFDERLEEDERLFPNWVWKRYERGEVEKVMVRSRIEDEHKGAAERMLMVAFWCVQYEPERRPPMSKVIKMLEGEVEIMPPSNPWPPLFSSAISTVDVERPTLDSWDAMSSSSAGVSGKSNPMKHGNAIVADAENATVENFINEIEREKPIRFTGQQLAGFTCNYTTRLGSGGFGVVYKGEFPNGIAVAVKVLNRSLDNKSVEEQFMAEMGTIGRTFHANLVRIYGFCFDSIVRALVYEYMDRGSLDTYLFNETHAIPWEKLHEIAIGTARGLTYLHEKCEQRIIHYDIKPANILLDHNFSPKVADFGLAKLSNRENTHVSISGGRGTLGYAAPEMWMQTQVTYKCDVYSFGMLLFELVGRRRNIVASLEEDERWFPKWVWERYENGEVEKVMVRSRIEDEHKAAAERMLMVALWCVQYQPERRPPMSMVVKMLEGEIEIMPPLNPFQHLLSSSAPCLDFWVEMSSSSGGVTGKRFGDTTSLIKS